MSFDEQKIAHEILNRLGAATGNEHQKYTVDERIEWLKAGIEYANRELDKARERVRELGGL